MIHTSKITGTAATVPLISVPLQIRWVQLLAPSTNSADALIGDETTSSTVGFPLTKGSAQMIPALFQGGYDMHRIYVYLATNDVLQVLYEDFA